MPGSSAWRNRGGNWVLAQFVLFALVVAAALLPPRWPEAVRPLFVAAGVALALPGVLLVVWAWRMLGEAATPFPRPRGRLVETGPYDYMRHPIYTGGLLFFLGLALATSVAALVPVAALVVFWRKKAALEEAWLEERDPDYAEYRARVPAFVPRPRAG
jgi:protein-S-isoprenylcysteine O-methyltransferase Ste14